MPRMSSASEISDDDFARLLAFRDGLRRFLRWSETQANAIGLTATQHQLLLSIRGHHGDPSISEIAEHLLLRHHSVVELINRAVAAGLVARVDDPNDHRVARVRLTVVGADKVALLASAHLEELSRLRSNVRALWANLPDTS